ncbi:MAG: group II intron reverse transcriptase/maturase [Candidatus Omnitrophota bacterium]
MELAKPFEISKEVVAKAYRKVKANKGAAGVDGETIEAFDRNLKNNLYKVWNRMSSGTYFPPAVRRVEIQKKQGGKRTLGIPTVADRVAQEVVKKYLEPKLEKIFHEDSYGYRPNKSAHEAIGKTRQRCWQREWVLDLDISKFFDTIDHELLMRAIRHQKPEKWVILYVERWLKAPEETREGKVRTRDKGTPQGGVISPMLANLYLHYAFDKWMEREHKGVKFERYADDIIIHCEGEAETKGLKEEIEERLEKCGLSLNERKTKIVNCRGKKRSREYEDRFDYLGYTFRVRSTKKKGGRIFGGFNPAVSERAKKEMRKVIKAWKLHTRTTGEIADIAKAINPTMRGWINYYGKYHKSELRKVFRILNWRLAKWAKRKYKRLRGNWREAIQWLKGVYVREKELFAHWQINIQP